MQTLSDWIGFSSLLTGISIGYLARYLQDRKENQRIKEYGTKGWDMWNKATAELNEARLFYSDQSDKQHQMILECFQTIRERNKTIAEQEALANRLKNLIEKGLMLHDN